MHVLLFFQGMLVEGPQGPPGQAVSITFSQTPVLPQMENS